MALQELLELLPLELDLNQLVEEESSLVGLEVMQDYAAVLAHYEPKQKVVPLKGEAFYSRVRAAYAIVASGERRLYGNLIIRKGVIHPASP